MKSATLRTAFGSLTFAFVLGFSAVAQQGAQPVQGTAGQASQPGGVNAGAAPEIPAAAATRPNSTAASPARADSVPQKPQTNAALSENDNADNPYDPLLEPPPLPKGKPTLIGGTATHVDHVRNRLTVQPFGKGTKVKMFVDERSHIYRNGAETTVLGIQKGDRVYADTMLDGSRIFAKNIRVITQPGLAEVRGQVIALHPDKGTISVQDQLSSRPVTFAVAGNTKYSSSKGAASSGDVRAGSLIEVQFASNRQGQDVAQEIVVLAKPGDDYVFSGVVTSVDMHNSLLIVENRSDEQDYEVHFSNGALANPRALKVGSEVTARATFDGKQYKASNVRVDDTKPQENGEQSKVE